MASGGRLLGRLSRLPTAGEKALRVTEGGWHETEGLIGTRLCFEGKVRVL